MKDKFILITTAISLFMTPLCAYAQTVSMPDAQAVMDNVNKNFGKISFKGLKTQQVARQDMVLNAKAEVLFNNKNSFLISIKDPTNINGISIYTDEVKEIAYLPNALYFINSSKAGLEIPFQVLIGKITDDPVLMEKNYSFVLKNNDKVGKRDAYVLDLQPKHGFTTPGRKYWVDQQNYQILREERYWDPNSGSYFVSYYDQLEFENIPKNSFKITQPNLKKIEFDKKKDNFFETYINKEKAEKACKQKISLPTNVPAGFMLKNIEVIRLFDTNIIMLAYSDGLNSLWVTYRKEANFFLTLAAGIFSLNILQNLGDLSYHLPYNYFSSKRDNYFVVSFGDLLSEDLQKTADSVAVKNL